MATVVTGVRDVVDRVRERFAWVDPVLLAWVGTVGAVLLGAEAFDEDYDMLVATLRILFYFTLFEFVIGIPDEQTDTPNTEQLFSLFSALGAGGLGYSIEVAAGLVAGDMTAAQLLGLGLLNSRINANYTTTELSIRGALFEEGPVTHPYTTVMAATAVTIPLLLKVWVFVFGKAHAPQVRSPATFVLVSTTAATAGLVVYYLGNGLSWGQLTGEADDGGPPAAGEADTSNPRRAESGFEFPAQKREREGPRAGPEVRPERENPVADHPVASQRETQSR